MNGHDDPGHDLLFEPDALRAEDEKIERGDYREDQATGGGYPGPYYGRNFSGCLENVCVCHDARVELKSTCSHCGCRPLGG